MRHRSIVWCAAAVVLVLGCRGGPSHTPPDPAPVESASSADAAPALRPADAAPVAAAAMDAGGAPAGAMVFDGACDDGKRAVVAFVGDVLVHHELQKQAASHRRRWRTLWAGVADLLDGADATYANLEVPLAPGLAKNAREVPDPGLEFDNVVYTGYPRFNAHPSLAVDLRRDGVDVVSTANNHTFDRELEGIDRTIDSLRKAKLKFAGTRRSDEGTKGGTAVTKAGPLKIGWIACAAFTNRFKKLDTEQIIRCDDEVLELIRALNKRKSIDAVIVTPHWGRSYVHEPTRDQVKSARAWLDAGATAVIGAHPHVLQPWEQYTTKDGRQTLIVYSLGNFVSHQPELPRRSTAIVYLGLTRGKDRQTRINGVRYVPVHVRQSGDRFFAEAIDRVGGPADAREHITSIYPAGNVMDPDDDFVTAPECERGSIDR